MHGFFDQFGRLIDSRWRETNYDERAFPEIARTALEEQPPAESLSLDDVLDAAFGAVTLPRQHLESNFGQPPLTVFETDGFYIEILFWVEHPTSIHEHSFSGAFHILHGTSLQTAYSFIERDRVSTNFLLGDIQIGRVDLLERGATVPIEAGRNFAHMTDHLEVPTVSVVVRTHRDDDRLPQYDYYPPFVAIAPFESATPLRKRKLEMLKTLYAAAWPGRDRYLRRMVEESDLLTTVEALKVAWFAKPERSKRSYPLGAPVPADGDERQRDAAARAEILALARDRHGPRLDQVAQTLEVFERRVRLNGKRHLLDRLDHRLLLALALDPPPLDRLLEIVGRHAPGRSPIDTLLLWVSEIAAADRRRPPREPVRVLGTADIDDDWLFAFRCRLEGLSANATIQAFELMPRRAAARRGENEILALLDLVKGNPMLGPLGS